MPSILSSFGSEPVHLVTNEERPYEPPQQTSTDKSTHAASIPKHLLNGISADGSGSGQRVEEVLYEEPDGINSSLQALPNGRSSDSMESHRERSHRRNESNNSTANGYAGSDEAGKHNPPGSNGFTKPSATEQALPSRPATATQPATRKSQDSAHRGKSNLKGHGRVHSLSAPQSQSSSPTYLNGIETSPVTSEAPFTIPATFPQSSKVYAQPILPNAPQAPASSSSTSLHPVAPRLHHRHTLEVPRVSTSRTSRDFSLPITASDGGSDSGRFSPSPRTPRASANLARAPTRSIHSDMYLDDVPPDGDMARWTETVRQKRASRRKRKEEEEDDRVVVGTKVDMNHVNWVTAYNMLTGIRFTVSRTNAKINRDLTDADFDARHKFSFDM